MHEEETGLQSAGTWIAVIGITISSLMMADFMPKWNVLPPIAWIAIAAVTGGLGFALGYPPRLASFMGGLIGGACIPFALMGYVAMRSQLSNTYFTVELLIPALVGALPGLAVYALFAWLLKPDEDGVPDTM